MEHFKEMDMTSLVHLHIFFIRVHLKKNSYISIQKVYYRWELTTSCIFSLVVVVDLDFLLSNFRETESNIDSLVYQVTFLIGGIGLAMMVVAFM